MGVLKLGVGLLTGSIVAVGAGGGAPLLAFVDFGKLFSLASSEVTVESSEEIIPALTIQPATLHTVAEEQAQEPNLVQTTDSRAEEAPKEGPEVTSNETTITTPEENPAQISVKEPEEVPKKVPEIFEGEVISEGSAKIKFHDLDNSIESAGLTGEWFFLNYSKEDVSSLVSRNFVDIAIPSLKDDKRLSKGEDNLLDAKLLFCGKGINGTSGEFVNGGAGKIDTTVVKCRELGKDWMYGIIFGRKYGVSFIVKRDSEYGNKLDNCKAELEDNCSFGKVVLGGTSWWKKLVYVAGAREILRGHKWHKWDGIWRKVEKNLRKENFVLGEIFDVENESRRGGNRWVVDGTDYENCNSGDETIGQCRMGIVDVSNYTLKKDGSSSIWSNKFTPKLNWKRVEKEQ